MASKKIFDIGRLWKIKILGIPIIFYIALFSFSPLIGFLLNKVFA
jgi:hypothetical protein